MCTCMAKRRKSGGKISGIGKLGKGLSVNRVGGLVAGGAAAKLVNPILTQTVGRFMPANDPATPGREGQIIRASIHGAKILVGNKLSQSKSEFLQNAGEGMMVVAGIELVSELFPGMNLSGFLDDALNVGSVVEIDLNREMIGSTSSNEFDKDLEAYHDVAGFADEYVDDAMELAGVYEL